MTLEIIAEIVEKGGDKYQTSEDMGKALRDTRYRVFEDRESGRILLCYEEGDDS